MNPRTVISLANLAAVALTFAVLILLPQYSDLAFYALLGWMLVGFVLFYTFRSARSAPSPGGTFPSSGTAAVDRSGPMPSGAPSAPSAPLDFCIFCGNTLPVGSAACPSCGHRVLPT